MKHEEKINEKWGFSLEYDKVLQKETSEFQNIILAQDVLYGNILIIDDILQVVEGIDWQYHEVMSYFPLLCKDETKNVLILGGGDGGILKNILSYSGVEKVDFVDIDEKVIEFSKKHLQRINKNAFLDPRVNVLVQDARKYIEECKEKYDLIIMDMTDPFGPSKFLYTKEYFIQVRSHLKNDGIYIMHTESPDARPLAFASINKTLREVFTNVDNMLNSVMMYGGLWSYAIAGQDFNLKNIKKEDIKKRIKEKGLKLKLIDEEIFFSMQVLPPYIKAILNSNAKIISDLDYKFEDNFIEDNKIKEKRNGNS